MNRPDNPAMKDSSLMGIAPGTEPGIPAGTPDSPVRLRRRRLGLTLICLGLGGFLPLLYLVVVNQDFRQPGAVLMMAFWAVWFAGKTLLKLNR